MLPVLFTEHHHCFECNFFSKQSRRSFRQIEGKLFWFGPASAGYQIAILKGWGWVGGRLLIRSAG